MGQFWGHPKRFGVCTTQPLPELKMKILAVLALILSMDAHAVRYVPTIPGTDVPDPGAEALVVRGNEAYYTLPNLSARDLSRGGYYRQGNEWIPTLPSSHARDWSEPAIKMEGDGFWDDF